MTESNKGRQFDIDEMRLIADLRIMHSKVHELFEVVSVLTGARRELHSAICRPRHAGE